MKQLFLNSTLNCIKKKYQNLNNIELEEYRYGLEGFYILTTKTIIIFTLSLLMGVFREMIILFLSFNTLRITGAGIHARKSTICLSLSSFIFVLIPIILRNVIIPFNIKCLIGIIEIILIYKYSPSDTEKKPIIKAKRRESYKIVTTLSCILLVFIFLTIKEELISNLIIVGILVEVILISPITYKIFKQNYNNYLNYN